MAAPLIHQSGRGRTSIAPDLDALARRAADEFTRRATECYASAGSFSVALSGGSTPRRVYQLLADEHEAFRKQIPWPSIHFFWGDERHVPPDHPDSNYRMAFEALLARVPVPPANIHRIPAELADANAAAVAYEEELRRYFQTGAEGVPRFDLILLGLGADGHTASLFPGSPALLERRRLVLAPWVPQLNSARITLTPPVLNRAAKVVFVASGEGKAEAVAAVLPGPYDPGRWPAQIVNPDNGDVLWLLDSAAAERLRPPRSAEREA